MLCLSTFPLFSFLFSVPFLFSFCVFQRCTAAVPLHWHEALVGTLAWDLSPICFVVYVLARPLPSSVVPFSTVKPLVTHQTFQLESTGERGVLPPGVKFRCPIVQLSISSFTLSLRHLVPWGENLGVRASWNILQTFWLEPTGWCGVLMTDSDKGNGSKSPKNTKQNQYSGAGWGQFCQGVQAAAALI